MHEILELTDFKNIKTNNKYINNLLDTFNFKDATIYQELEFVFVKDDIKAYCKKKLSKYMIPSEFVFRKRLPKTKLGKVDFKSLEEDTRGDYDE